MNGIPKIDRVTAGREGMARRITHCCDCPSIIVASWPLAARRRPMIRCAPCASKMHARERARGMG